MFLEFSQKMLIEYQHDNVQIHGHDHEYVHLLVSPQVLYVFGMVTRNADEKRHLLCPYLLLWPWRCPFLSIFGRAEPVFVGQGAS